MSRYAKGARFERRVRDELIERGFFVARSAGSRGPLDLVAFGKDENVQFIQCKLQRERMSKKEKQELYELARRFGVKAIFAFKEDHRIVYQEILR